MNDILLQKYDKNTNYVNAYYEKLMETLNTRIIIRMEDKISTFVGHDNRQRGHCTRIGFYRKSEPNNLFMMICYADNKYFVDEYEGYFQIVIGKFSYVLRRWLLADEPSFSVINNEEFILDLMKNDESEDVFINCALYFGILALNAKVKINCKLSAHSKGFNVSSMLPSFNNLQSLLANDENWNSQIQYKYNIDVENESDGEYGDENIDVENESDGESGDENIDDGELRVGYESEVEYDFGDKNVNRNENKKEIKSEEIENESKTELQVVENEIGDENQSAIEIKKENESENENKIKEENAMIGGKKRTHDEMESTNGSFPDCEFNDGNGSKRTEDDQENGGDVEDIDIDDIPV